MSRVLRRWVSAVVMMAAGWSATELLMRSGAVAAQDRAPLPAASGSQVASVESLKSEAFTALRSGKFDQTTELLGKAAALSTDPNLSRMADWAKGFESQRQVFLAERRKQYEKAVGEVKLLETKGHFDFAIDRAARAALLAENKEAFRQQDWVKDIISRTAQKAGDYDKQEQWFKALRLYSDLGSIEMANPLWKERLKAATRRVRLLNSYSPDQFTKLKEVEEKESEAAEAIIKPTTQPTTKPAEKEDNNDAFRIDWRETLRGVQMDMLWSALLAAEEGYYRDVDYSTLLRGGLTGLRALATTKGLETTFPKLADAAKKQEFIKEIDYYSQAAETAKGRSAAQQQATLRSALAMLMSKNRQTIELPSEVIISEFADGAFAELDPFTSMIWPSDLEDFNRTTQGEFSGVGIQIQSDEDGSLKVVSPLEDSPAYKAGIRAGDIITHINGKNAKGITTTQAVKTITGPSGTFVALTVKSPDSAVHEYTIKRETIKVASVRGWLHKPGGGWDYLVDPDNKIGYLRLSSFTKDTAHELDRAMEQMDQAGAKALILDLRYNPGGLLTAATDVSDKFLSGGTIVSTRPDRDTGNNPITLSAHADGESKLPMVVLVNQYSASASEIVSGALKDHKRAFIVGERTFGKGSVQMLFPLADRSAYLKLTTSHYYLPNGKCIHREENSTEWGVDPNLTVELTPEQMKAAIDAQHELDILRDVGSAPAEGKLEKVKDVAAGVQNAVSGEKKDLMSADPQLSAGVLLLRLQLAGAQI